MAKRSPKIALYKEGSKGEALTAKVLKAPDMVDAYEVMQSDFVPEESTVQINDHGAFLAANLTEEEARKLAEAPEVIEVVDDIDVYALGPAAGGADEGDLAADLETGMLEPADAQWLEAEPYPEFASDEELMSPEQVRLLCEMENPLDDDLELEWRLTEGMAVDEEPTFEVPETEPPEPGEVEKLRRELVPWNVRRVMAPRAWGLGATGDGVRIAVVDTGIDRRHRDLRFWGGVSFVPGERSFQDNHGHGTHVTGIIAAQRNGWGLVGVAPEARLSAVKVLNSAGQGKLSWVLNGLVWCSRNRIDIVNLSLGSRARTHDTRAYNRAFEHIGKNLLRRNGILAVAAAGNDYHRPVSDPARCPSYLAVSAVTRRGSLTPFTNIGPQIELCAPGQGILSTWPTGFRRLNGTSMACPHVTGVAALVKSWNPTWHGDKIRCHLCRTAVDLGPSGRDWPFGYGLVNAFRALSFP